MAGEMTCPARFCTDRLGALATTVSPVSFKPPQNDNIPLHGRRWKAIAKTTLLWKLLGGEFASNFLSCPLDFVHKMSFFFLKRTMIISELRGSPGCGCLPRYVDCSLCVWQWLLSSDDENKSLCHGTEPIMLLINVQEYPKDDKHNRCNR